MTINPINKHNPITREPKEEATNNASTKSKQLRVIVPPIKSVINACPGFAKKQLADYKLDILALCEPAFAGLKGVLLQSKPRKDGRSQNEHIAALQASLEDR